MTNEQNQAQQVRDRVTELGGGMPHAALYEVVEAFVGEDPAEAQRAAVELAGRTVIGILTPEAVLA